MLSKNFDIKINKNNIFHLEKEYDYFTASPRSSTKKKLKEINLCDEDVVLKTVEEEILKSKFSESFLVQDLLENIISEKEKEKFKKMITQQPKTVGKIFYKILKDNAWLKEYLERSCSRICFSTEKWQDHMGDFNICFDLFFLKYNSTNFHIRFNFKIKIIQDGRKHMFFLSHHPTVIYSFDEFSRGKTNINIFLKKIKLQSLKKTIVESIIRDPYMKILKECLEKYGVDYGS